MSSQEQFMANGGAPPYDAKHRLDCPQCKYPMNVRKVTLLLFASNMDDVLFGCEPCGLEIKRALKRG